MKPFKAVKIDTSDPGDFWEVLAYMESSPEPEVHTEQEAVYAVYAHLYRGAKGFDRFFAEVLGVCPECRKHSGRRNLGGTHVLYCLEHKTKWYGGENLFPDWKLETAEQWSANERYLREFRNVTPAFSTRPKPAS